MDREIRRQFRVASGRVGDIMDEVLPFGLFRILEGFLSRVFPKLGENGPKNKPPPDLSWNATLKGNLFPSIPSLSLSRGLPKRVDLLFVPGRIPQLGIDRGFHDTVRSGMMDEVIPLLLIFK